MEKNSVKDLLNKIDEQLKDVNQHVFDVIKPFFEKYGMFVVILACGYLLYKKFSRKENH
jgi:hypothetical protein